MSHAIRAEWEAAYKNKDSFVSQQREVAGGEERYDGKQNISGIAWRVALSKQLSSDAQQWEEQFVSLMVLTDAVVATGKAATEALQYAPPAYYAVTREEMPTLYEMVDRIAQQCGVVAPIITIADHPALVNAYVIQSAQSAALNQSILLLGSGFFQSADDDAIEGILAHECAHIAEKHPVQKARYLHTVPTYINHFYNLLPVALAVVLVYFSAGKIGTIAGWLGMLACTAKPLVLQWLNKKQVSQSVAIEREADQRAVELYRPAEQKLVSGLRVLADREKRELVRRDEGFNALRDFVQQDDSLAAHVATGLLNFVNAMENNIRALAAQKMAFYPTMSQRISEIENKQK